MSAAPPLIQVVENHPTEPGVRNFRSLRPHSGLDLAVRSSTQIGQFWSHHDDKVCPPPPRGGTRDTGATKTTDRLGSCSRTLARSSRGGHYWRSGATNTLLGPMFTSREQEERR
jgi:hypothetical protein